MPRFVSLVTTFAAEGLSAGATHTFKTPFCGARNAICFPSGLTCGPARSGLPNRTSRAMRSLPLVAFDGVGFDWDAVEATWALCCAHPTKNMVAAPNIMKVFLSCTDDSPFLVCKTQ